MLCKYYLIAAEGANEEQSLVPEIFWDRASARNYVSGSDSRFCYYYIYEVWLEDNKFKTKETDKIWNHG